MGEVGKDNKFTDEVFTYKVTKDQKVFIYWYGKQVTILKGKASLRFLNKIQSADFQEAQYIMARATGNFKRGNEKK